MCEIGLHRYREDDSDDNEVVAYGKCKSPGVFLDGLQNFVEVAAELGDLSDPAFREWLAQDLKSQTDFRSKVRTPGRRAAPCKCICRSALLLAWLACGSSQPWPCCCTHHVCNWGTGGCHPQADEHVCGAICVPLHLPDDWPGAAVLHVPHG